MAITVVQVKESATNSVTLDSAPTPGNHLVVMSMIRGNASATVSTATGLTRIVSSASGIRAHATLGEKINLYHRLVQSGDGASWSVVWNGGTTFATYVVELAADEELVITDAPVETNDQTGAAMAVTITPTTDAYVFGAFVAKISTGFGESASVIAGTSLVGDVTGNPPYAMLVRATSGPSSPPTAVTLSAQVDYAPWSQGWGGVAFAFAIVPVFVADFSATPLSGDPGLSVDFTDESAGGTGTPDAWAWDFGDGLTSTSQDPTHVYADAGVYTVTLTAETDDAETDTETKVAYISVGDPYVPPLPGLAVIEIRAAVPGSSRWGSALWGVGTWSPAGWQDVTPQSVDALIRWGSHQPERGILAETEAGTWMVNTYDPERLLDPGNAASPYAADLRAGLPIRLLHRGTIIRQGVAETIAFAHKGSVGGIRATDAVSLLARAKVPEDSILSDTLRARARDAIAAAGLAVLVEPDPPAGDPALAPQIESERSVWRHVADAALQVLHVPYIDRVGTLRFRSWSAPYERGRGVDETQLVDLMTVVATQGLYSVVQARQTVGEGGAIEERRITPAPRYGAVAYLRDDATPDAGDWAAAVLADRALQTVQWIPGEIYPLDADAVEYFATLETLERLGVDLTTADPAVDVTGLIVGGEIRVRSKRDDSARWAFSLELAQTATAPLYTDTDPPEFLRTEAGDGYLYGD